MSIRGIVSRMPRVYCCREITDYRVNYLIKFWIQTSVQNVLLWLTLLMDFDDINVNIKNTFNIQRICYVLFSICSVHTSLYFGDITSKGIHVKIPGENNETESRLL